MPILDPEAPWKATNRSWIAEEAKTSAKKHPRKNRIDDEQEEEKKKEKEEENVNFDELARLQKNFVSLENDQDNEGCNNLRSEETGRTWNIIMIW